MNGDDRILRHFKTHTGIEVTKTEQGTYLLAAASSTCVTGTTTVSLPPGYVLDNSPIDIDVIPSKEDQKSENYYLRKGKVINKPTGLLAKLIKKV